jgi:hypothetical protein
MLLEKSERGTVGANSPSRTRPVPKPKGNVTSPEGEGTHWLKRLRSDGRMSEIGLFSAQKPHSAIASKGS